MSLRERLTELMAVRPARYRALLDDVTVRLRGSALERVLKPGDAMPEFVLPDAEGKLVYSGDLLTEGPLVVVFFRGDWCPFCTTTLRALNDVMDDIAAAGGRLVALNLDTGEFAGSVTRSLDLRFPVLSDVDGGTALQFGTIYRVPDGLRQFFLENGIDLARRHGETAWFLPIPAAFVTDTAGIIRYAYASGDNTDRAEPSMVVALVREIASDDVNGAKDG